MYGVDYHSHSRRGDSKGPSPEGEGFDRRLKSAKDRASLSRPVLLNGELPVVLGISTLSLYVLCYHLVRHISTTAHEISTRPEVPTPELPIQPPILHQQVMGRLALHGLHQSARRYRWWYAHKQMHMIRLRRSSQNLHVLAATDLADQLSYPLPHLSSKHRLAVLRREHEMVVQLEDRMRRMPVPPHLSQRTASLLKAPPKPKGGGFHPPRMGQ